MNVTVIVEVLGTIKKIIDQHNVSLYEIQKENALCGNAYLLRRVLSM